MEWLEQLVKQGHELTVFTARSNHEPVWNWLTKHDLDRFFSGVTNLKQGTFDCYIDDRAIGYVGTWPDIRKWQQERLAWIRKSVALDK